MNRRILGSLLCIVALIALPFMAQAYTVNGTETGALGADQWYLQNDGDLVPHTDSSYDIGESSSEVATIYGDTVTVTTLNVGTVDPVTVVGGSSTAPANTLYIKSTGTSTAYVLGIVMKGKNSNSCVHARMATSTGPFEYLTVTCPD